MVVAVAVMVAIMVVAKEMAGIVVIALAGRDHRREAQQCSSNEDAQFAEL